ncbi:hypothetical protein Cni_G20707 [Canna indica]|uniref:Pectinesterase n=1 Tax=Canna indica TaxID=4628 RepID=A0AAQ3KN43_9LILI|nr:hypothetical protein Cni_G20707 [Canna indica]
MLLLLFLLLSPSVIAEDENGLQCRNTTAHLSREQRTQRTAIQLALDAAVRFRDHFLHAQDAAAAAAASAGSDCAELSESTVQQLDRCLHPSSTRSDLQTWLSAALTNLQTCRTGYAELNVSIPPFLHSLTNVSELIRNSLAAVAARGELGEKKSSGEFPEWTCTDGRALIRALQRDVAEDYVVAKDGTGDFSNISGAVDAAVSNRQNTSRRLLIYVKEGVYEEYVSINAANLTLIGDGIGKTVITGNRSVVGGPGDLTTFNTATVAIQGEFIIARGITFRNTAGPENHQAVALRCQADFAVFYQCSFEGYQDTLYVHSNRQFFRECDVYGTIDFIFGNAAAVLQKCNIYPRRPMGDQRNTVTAQGREDLSENTAFAFQNCKVTAAPDLAPVQRMVKTYLGRPWKKYSRTVVMESCLDSLIAPEGWLEWNENGDAVNTLFYGEYKNTGPGSNTSGRVKWPGYKNLTEHDASMFTVKSLIDGGSWLPATGVPFD